MSFLSPDPPKPPPPPPPAPTKADASVITAGQREPNYSSLISTGPRGLQRKANTQKGSLMGGGTL